MKNDWKIDWKIGQLSKSEKMNLQPSKDHPIETLLLGVQLFFELLISVGRILTYPRAN